MPARSATAVALIAFVGIALYFNAVHADGHSVAATVWTLAGYFTILTNALVALVFGALALTRDPGRWPRLVVGTTLSIMLVGIVYALLLSGLQLTGGSDAANLLLHVVTPIVVPLWWLACMPKGRLGWSDPFVWSIYPLAYLAYALVRGGIEGRYAYPFIDPVANGWGGVALTCAIIAAGFILAGFLLVALDRALASRAPAYRPSRRFGRDARREGN